MRLIVFRLFIGLGLLAGLLVACGGGSGADQASLTVTPGSTEVVAGESGKTFTAALRNSQAEITWSLSNSVGTLSSSTGTTTTYNPPAQLDSDATVTLTARASDKTATATITVRAGGTSQPSLSVAPKTRTVSAGDPSFALQATLQGSTDPITWSLTGVGEISADTGPAVMYTPPGSVTGTATATITATAGSLTDSATITVEQGSTITVSGRVVRFNGDPAGGVYVQIDDAAGVTFSSLSTEKDGQSLTPMIATQPDGTFTVSGVTTPYTLSVVPPAGSEMPQTWTEVTRPDPTLVIDDFFSTPMNCSIFNDGVLDVSLNTAVGTGNYAWLLFVGEGISYLNANSYTSTTLDAGDTFGVLFVPFDPAICADQIDGKLVYIEFDSTNQVVRSATRDASVRSGNTTFTSLTLLTAQTELISGSVTFPVGSDFAEIYLLVKIGGASAWTAHQFVTGTDPEFEIAVPRLDGVEYRVMALAGAMFGAQTQWVHSDILSLPATNVTLQLPSLGATLSPAGSIGSQTTPTFRRTQVSGTNFNYTLLEDPFLTGVEWLGVSSSTAIELPTLPPPAQLRVGSAAAPNEYLWTPLNSLNVRDGGSSDVLLDGRMIGKRFFGFDALFYPDLISAGSYNSGYTSFTLP